MAIDEDRNDRVNSLTASQAAQYGDVILEDTNNANKKISCKKRFLF